MGLTQESYRYCFAGVGLPSELHNKFASASNRLQHYIPGIELMYLRVPGHITSVYAGDLTKGEMADMATEIAYNAIPLRGKSLRITGELLVDPVKKKRIIIHVEAPTEWYNFCDNMYDALGNLASSDLRQFTRQAHTTVGKYKTPLDRLYCKYNFLRIKNEVAKVGGEVPIKEIIGWGMDPGDEKTSQVERFRVSVADRRPVFYSLGNGAQSQRIAS